jgi:hypothetical protein
MRAWPRRCEPAIEVGRVDMVAARGEPVLRDVYVINRGYEALATASQPIPVRLQ